MCGRVNFIKTNSFSANADSNFEIRIFGDGSACKITSNDVVTIKCLVDQIRPWNELAMSMSN